MHPKSPAVCLVMATQHLGCNWLLKRRHSTNTSWVLVLCQPPFWAQEQDSTLACKGPTLRRGQMVNMLILSTTGHVARMWSCCPRAFAGSWSPAPNI